MNGEIIGWRTICDGEEVHSAIIERKMEHLEKAKPTLFGSSVGYDHLHGEDRLVNMENISRGKS